MCGRGGGQVRTPTHPPRRQSTTLDNSNAAIVGLAVLLLDVVPHAAEPERVFSNMKFISSDRRNRMSQSMMTMLTTIKMDEQRKRKQEQQPRPATKPLRTVTGDGRWITNEEALAAAKSTSAAAAAAASTSAANGTGAELQQLPEAVEEDLTSATAEELGAFLQQLYHVEAEQQAASGTLSYVELLQSPWPGVDLRAPQLQPGFEAPVQQRTPVGLLGDGNDTNFDAQQLVQRALGGGGGTAGV